MVWLTITGSQLASQVTTFPERTTSREPKTVWCLHPLAACLPTLLHLLHTIALFAERDAQTSPAVSGWCHLALAARSQQAILSGDIGSSCLDCIQILLAMRGMEPNDSETQSGFPGGSTM